MTLNGGIMPVYLCYYRNKMVSVKAPTSYEAQQLAAKKFQAKKAYDVLVKLADTEHVPDF
jgi:hypothetical protein